MRVTSPPYWGLRDYHIPSQIGLEPTLPEFLANLRTVFSEARRVLKDDGVLWLNIGDGYTSGNRGWRAPDKKNRARAMSVRPDTPAGLKPKDLLGIPWRLAFTLQDDGWYLRTDIIWNKPNAMPESVKDRPTRAHEYVFMLTKSDQYRYDRSAIVDPNGRNKRSVWDINTVAMPALISRRFRRSWSSRASRRAPSQAISCSIPSSAPGPPGWWRASSGAGTWG
jgi:site-specific DNA-methyltransferase (adenine-specific)